MSQKRPAKIIRCQRMLLISPRGRYTLLLRPAPEQCKAGVRDSVMALRDIDTELHEHANTVHGIKNLIHSQNRDVHILAIQKLVLNKTIDNDIFPEVVREFARNYFRQKRNSFSLTRMASFVCSIHSPNVHSTRVRA